MGSITVFINQNTDPVTITIQGYVPQVFQDDKKMTATKQLFIEDWVKRKLAQMICVGEKPIGDILLSEGLKFDDVFKVKTTVSGSSIACFKYESLARMPKPSINGFIFLGGDAISPADFRLGSGLDHASKDALILHESLEKNDTKIYLERVKHNYQYLQRDTSFTKKYYLDRLIYELFCSKPLSNIYTDLSAHKKQKSNVLAKVTNNDKDKNEITAILENISNLEILFTRLKNVTIPIVVKTKSDRQVEMFEKSSDVDYNNLASLLVDINKLASQLIEKMDTKAFDITWRYGYDFEVWKNVKSSCTKIQLISMGMENSLKILWPERHEKYLTAEDSYSSDDISNKNVKVWHDLMNLKSDISNSKLEFVNALLANKNKIESQEWAPCTVNILNEFINNTQLDDGVVLKIREVIDELNKTVVNSKRQKR